ncbi:biotin/lipoyl-containing protein [Boseongicola aestuarii]|uniref:Dihydrolipoyllysine-residue succinyltransferase component of 2-oxoglutarate dehydrogenase complex n=1 Tax=Boseongicola aestuarii TaxID=1470561 RepID=A0A238IZA9_9RHOB|nr:biotin/lipoyl-containing protein [Boseongicola aestuarii]SMX23819.1 Dihydrolipoyllysine-residue succinyltransferase component of 2-oxoglutarate dehydrogenase complex [Boseongicola aestuarii]
MPSEVKMPQLGMNQDSAVIVAWLKASGDKVTRGEPIFEVETDKATMEVEATSDGYLAGIRAEEGADIPVGDIIAMIVETADEVAEHASASVETTETSKSAEGEVEPEAKPEPEAAVTKTEETVPNESVETPAAAPRATSGPVLASPLAKRLAKERGVDLAALRASGLPEPIHAADLSRSVAGGQSQLSARVVADALAALLQRSQNADRTTLLAAFTAGAWRQVFDTVDVTIAIRGLDGATAQYPAPRDGETGTAAAISLVDLCDTRLQAYAPAGGGITISVGEGDSHFALTLSFNEASLPMPHAITLLDAIAARVEDPIRQLI